MLTFPAYRPDLARGVAHRLDLNFYDYRAEEMIKRGFETGKLTLDALNHSLRGLATNAGTVVFNVEALLATKPPEERRAWLQGFVRSDWPNLLVLPLTLFVDETHDITSRILRFRSEDLPPQGVVSRLLN